MADSRYPYTYAADYIRGIAGYNENGTKLSRSDASQIRQVFSDILEFYGVGINDYMFACMLADRELQKEEWVNQKQAEEFLEQMRRKPHGAR